MRHVVLALTVALLSSCAMPVAQRPELSALATGGSLRVVIPGEITTLDPWEADASSLIATQQLFETLVTVDIASGTARPNLAVSWQTANDGTSWTFTLREGVYFHDGAPLEADAVVASFARGRASAAYRQLLGDPTALTSVRAIDSRTVRFDLRAPFGPFLAHLAAPQAAIARGTAGTGPFAAPPGALAPDGTLSLRRSDAYWRHDSARRALPYVDALVLRPVRDAGARLAELRGGRAEIAVDLPVAQASAAKSDPNLVLVPRTNAVLASLGIDAAAGPFERGEVRRAVAMAIAPASGIDALYASLARKATQVVPPGMLGYDDSVVGFASVDQSAAKKLLADAHVSTPIAADLAYPTYATAAYPDPQRIAQAIAADLGAVGFVVRLRAVDPGSLRTARASLTLDTTPIGLDPDDVFWPLFGSNDQSDTSLAVGLLRKARGDADPTRRAELYKQVSKLGRTNVTRIPLFFVDRANAASARVAGFVADPSASFGTVWLRP